MFMIIFPYEHLVNIKRSSCILERSQVFTLIRVEKLCSAITDKNGEIIFLAGPLDPPVYVFERRWGYYLSFYYAISSTKCTD